MAIARAELHETTEECSFAIANLAYTALTETGRYEPDYMPLSTAERVISQLGFFGVHADAQLLYQRGSEDPTHVHLYLSKVEQSELATVTNLAEYRRRKEAEDTTEPDAEATAINTEYQKTVDTIKSLETGPGIWS